MKAEIYQSLYTINESLQLTAEHLDMLKTEGIISPEVSEIGRTTVEQLRSKINLMALNALHTREREDAHRFEQQSIRLTKVIERSG